MTPQEAVKAMLAKGMSQYDIAEEVGANQSTISRILNQPEWEPKYALGLELVRLGKLAKRRMNK